MKKDFRRDAKVLAVDLEVAPTLMWGFGQYQVNPVKIVQTPILQAVSWKWIGDKGKPEVRVTTDYKMKNRFDDYGIVLELWRLFDEANVVLAHNGDKFDCKVANAFFLRHGMKPPSPYQTIDTLKAARRWFKFDNNRLDYLGKFLVGEGKTETTYKDVWYDLLMGEGKRQKQAGVLMGKYCRKDVECLEKIYYKLLPWIGNHPNMALAAEVDFICPRCGRDSDFRVKAYRRTGAQINAIQYQCKNCGGYVTKPLSKEEREELAEEGRLKSRYRNTV